MIRQLYNAPELCLKQCKFCGAIFNNTVILTAVSNNIINEEGRFIEMNWHVPREAIIRRYSEICDFRIYVVVLICIDLAPRMFALRGVEYVGEAILHQKLFVFRGISKTGNFK